MQLTGELAKVKLPNLLQLVKNGELTGKIAMLQGAKSATIYVERGNIVHVETDTGSGREALMDLFLWLTGSFSFMEHDLLDLTRSLNPLGNPDDAFDKLLRDGIAYLEQKKYLDQMRITGQTVLKPTEHAHTTMAALLQSGIAASASPINWAQPILERLDGVKTLAEALADVSLSRRAYAQGVYAVISEGLAVVVEPSAQTAGEQIILPEWVLARLRQDNTDVSQSIVDLVIWVDRVKCWMYQVDADFSRIIEQLDSSGIRELPDDDFFRDLTQELADYQGPLFGEAAIPNQVNMPLPGGQYQAPASQIEAPTEPGSHWPPDDIPAAMPSPQPQSDTLGGASKPPPSIEF